MDRLNRVVNQLAPGQQGLNANPCHAVLEKVPLAPPDAIFLTKNLFMKDKDPRKINLGVGAYRTNEGKPLVLNVVKKAEKLIVEDKKLDHEYLGIAGDDQFCTLSRELLFGKNYPAVKEERIATAQTISGTGAVRVGAAFVQKWLPGRTVYLSDPTWGNHNTILDHTGIKWVNYRYWKESTRSLDFDGMMEDLKKAPNGSVILLHACAHNPTGVDPTPEQWQGIARLMKEKDLVPFFDSAYQGFASGDLERDAYAVRYFGEQGFEMLVAQSYAKNFGLYNERAGALSIVAKDKKTAEACYSQLEAIIRPMYSNPPAHGCRIVKTILSTPALYDEWISELKGMANRIKQTRTMLFENLQKLGTPGDWKHIVSQIGMFSYTGLNKKQCEVLRDQLHVYLLLNGRISMAGINESNVEYLAKAIDEAVRKH